MVGHIAEICTQKYTLFQTFLSLQPTRNDVTRSPAVMLGWPHQRENAVSDGGGLTRPWLWRSSNPNLVMKFGTNKLEWMGYISAKFRDSSSRISWFAHRRFLPRPPTHPAHPMVITLPYTCWCGQNTYQSVWKWKCKLCDFLKHFTSRVIFLFVSETQVAHVLSTQSFFQSGRQLQIKNWSLIK